LSAKAITATPTVLSPRSNAAPVFPLVARALEAPSPQLREQGVVAMAHLARLHHAVDRRCLALLRSFGRGNAADDDLWTFIPHRKLPLWLWRHHTRERLAWWVRDRWRG